MENSLAVSQKVKHRAVMWPTYFTPRYTSKEAENEASDQIYLYPNVQGSTIHTPKNMEISVHQQMKR